MAFTGTEIIDQVPEASVFTTAQKVAAINAAIQRSWPSIKNVKIDSSVTLASSTYEYTPTATDVNLQWGFSVGYVTDDANPKRLLRRLGQRRSGTTWVILVPSGITSAYVGETLHLQYNARVARITALTDSVELPMDYLQEAVGYFLCRRRIGEGDQASVAPYEKLAAEYKDSMSKALLANRTGDLELMIPHVKEIDLKRYTGRYGEYLGG